MVDYNSNAKIVIAHYPRYAGGKVLLNCLGLSKRFALQNYHAPIVAEDKFNYLKKKIDEYDANTTWKDLELGCQSLFGDDFEQWLNGEFKNLNPQAHDVLSKDYYLPIISNTENSLSNLKKIFPNNVVISFFNCEKLVLSRKGGESINDSYIRIRNKLRRKNWPERCPTSLQDFSIDLLNEMQYYFPELYKKISLLSNDSFTTGDIKWNVEWFNDIDKTVNEIKNIYNTLGLDDFNFERVKYFFSQWKIKVYDPAIMD